MHVKHKRIKSDKYTLREWKFEKGMAKNTIALEFELNCLSLEIEIYIRIDIANYFYIS